ncbi:unnamed protein product [Clonostachys byssicola]|uniref:Uncharacterized protein n=1 Tax=Clonostachys byssicola TaxID=160290 RepID=A0A9N9UFX5_9HYPO|nr:unnamed protein product [Clonostachys byssicola]
MTFKAYCTALLLSLLLRMAPHLQELSPRRCDQCHDTTYILQRVLPVVIPIALILILGLAYCFCTPCRHWREQRRQRRREAEKAAARQRGQWRRERLQAMKQKDRSDELEQDGGPISIGEYEERHNSAGNKTVKPEKPPPTYHAATGQTPPKVYRDPNPNSMLNV